MDYRLQYIYEMYKDAKCELNYNNIFQLLIAVTLSAQTTDKKVPLDHDEIVDVLFEKYDSVEKLASANIEDVKAIIKPIGMANTKGRNIIEIAKIINEKYNGEVPCDVDKLLELPGVGNKTVNVTVG